MRISDWSSDVCSSDLAPCCRSGGFPSAVTGGANRHSVQVPRGPCSSGPCGERCPSQGRDRPCDRPGSSTPYRYRGRPLRCRSEEHTSELQSLMRISYSVFCLNKTKTPESNTTQPHTI